MLFARVYDKSMPNSLGKYETYHISLLKIEHNHLRYPACAVHVTIFITGGKFNPVSNFIRLHALTQGTIFYALLCFVLAI